MFLITLLLSLFIQIEEPQLPSEQSYQQIQQLTSLPNYGAGNNPNPLNNDVYVDRVESYFVESQYWENQYWVDTWSNFCSWITAMFNQDTFFFYFYEHMSSTYFQDFFSFLNKNKSNTEKRQQFYNELRTEYSVNSPAYTNILSIIIIALIYIAYKRKFFSNLIK